AEALNEADGPSSEVYIWLDMIRKRAGLKGVVESWELHSINPSKPFSQEGLRDIIQQERLIEFAVEGQRFWDLRRWKRAAEEFDNPITGWDIEQKTPERYATAGVIVGQTFSARDYLWPIGEDELLANKNTIQSPGW